MPCMLHLLLERYVAVVRRGGELASVVESESDGIRGDLVHQAVGIVVGVRHAEYSRVGRNEPGY
jgi:hypothetical protein